jgi:hypothetical protein
MRCHQQWLCVSLRLLSFAPLSQRPSFTPPRIYYIPWRPSSLHHCCSLYYVSLISHCAPILSLRRLALVKFRPSTVDTPRAEKLCTAQLVLWVTVQAPSEFQGHNLESPSCDHIEDSWEKVKKYMAIWQLPPLSGPQYKKYCNYILTTRNEAYRITH